MTIPLSQIAEWAALMPPLGISSRAKLAWRRFAYVKLPNGCPVAFPAKAALEWCKSTGAQEMTLDGALIVGRFGRSRISLSLHIAAIPCEEPYNPHNTIGIPGGMVRETCDLSDMVTENATCSTLQERKADALAKRIDKAKRDAKEAQTALDKATQEANDAQAVVSAPLADAVKQARIHLAALRAYRAFQRDPLPCPAWLAGSFERTGWDEVKQDTFPEQVDSRTEHAELAAVLNQAIAARNAYKPPTRWPSYFTAKDKKEKPDYGVPVYGPKWDKLKLAVSEARRALVRFLEARFKEYVTQAGLPSYIGDGWPVYPYSRARHLLKTWPQRQADLTSKLAEAQARLDKLTQAKAA